MVSEGAPVALTCSVALEAEPLEAVLARTRVERIGTRRALFGTIGDQAVVVLTGGMGKTNAAQALTALIESRSLAGVIGFGVGGGYADAGLEVGGLALATAEIYGDEGVLTADGWLSTREIGIPLVVQSTGPTFNAIELDPARVGQAREALRRASLAPVAGPFVTVSNCSGTRRRGDELRARFGAICETMEGAAYAHVCAMYEIPFLEIRGISNLVEDRDLRRWRLEAAAAAAARAVEVLMKAGWKMEHSRP